MRVELWFASPVMTAGLRHLRIGWRPCSACPGGPTGRPARSEQRKAYVDRVVELLTAPLRRAHGPPCRASPTAAIPDPSGGTVDAAGDFGRLLSRPCPDLPLLGGIDPHDEPIFGPGETGRLITEIDILLREAEPGREPRGLMRLRTMALVCTWGRDQLVFIGD
ncbi:hypothetical protein [Actinoplanes sp. NPDC049802]|uniref:hypothetical protein n=1 Tax=Actinoplanes sp. NPDC049802 TaxID=3154742 RepID=UPI0033CB8DA1